LKYPPPPPPFISPISRLNKVKKKIRALGSYPVKVQRKREISTYCVCDANQIVCFNLHWCFWKSCIILYLPHILIFNLFISLTHLIVKMLHIYQYYSLGKCVSVWCLTLLIVTELQSTHNSFVCCTKPRCVWNRWPSKSCFHYPILW